jgi:hypothetical protein
MGMDWEGLCGDESARASTVGAILEPAGSATAKGCHLTAGQWAALQEQTANYPRWKGVCCLLVLCCPLVQLLLLCVCRMVSFVCAWIHMGGWVLVGGRSGVPNRGALVGPRWQGNNNYLLLPPRVKPHHQVRTSVL